MTREDIIRMAREVCPNTKLAVIHNDDLVLLYLDERERFAALVAVHERDQCAFEIAESYRCGWDGGVMAERDECARACIEVGATKANSDDGLDIADLCAAVIRARGAQ